MSGQVAWIIFSWRTWGATKSVWARVQQDQNCIWERVNVTVVCRMVWGGETEGRETTCPNHLIGSSAPTEINKDLLTDWQTGWLTCCLQTTNPSPSEVPFFGTNHNGSSTWKWGQNSWTEMIGKRHDLAFAARERLKTRNCSLPKTQSSREGRHQREKHPRGVYITPILFPFFLYSSIMKGKCMAAVHKRWFYFHMWGCQRIWL